MDLLKISILGAALASTAACSGGAAPGAKPPGADASAPDAPPQKTVFDPLTQQLDRAREVQATVDRNTDDTRNAVDHQERGDPPP